MRSVNKAGRRRRRQSRPHGDSPSLSQWIKTDRKRRDHFARRHGMSRRGTAGARDGRGRGLGFTYTSDWQRTPHLCRMAAAYVAQCCAMMNCHLGCHRDASEGRTRETSRSGVTRIERSKREVMSHYARCVSLLSHFCRQGQRIEDQSVNRESWYPKPSQKPISVLFDRMTLCRYDVDVK
jgi:hypothetical protein